MNKKAESFGDLLFDNVIYLILLVMFIIGFMYYIYARADGAETWGDYYAKEIVKVINFAEPGDEVWLDVHKGSEIAVKKKVKSLSEMFTIDNVQNKVCVKLGLGRRTCYSYFNEVDIIGWNILPSEGKDESGQSTKNLLYFRVVDVQKKENVGSVGGVVGGENSGVINEA